MKPRLLRALLASLGLHAAVACWFALPPRPALPVPAMPALTLWAAPGGSVAVPAPSAIPTPPGRVRLRAAPRRMPADLPSLGANATSHIATTQAAAPANASASVSRLPPPVQAALAAEIQDATQASFVSVTTLDYPEWLKEQGVEGVVQLLVRVADDGAPAEIRVAHSSGFRALDQAALDGVRAWRFRPARLGRHTRVSWVRFPVRFVLDD